MEDWTRVLVYGTYDGFTRSTDGLSQINVILDGGERVEIPKEFVVSADQMVNKNKIKLKDVIARIKGFDLGTKAVWLNEILYKLGSDYGLHKYYAGYKQGKLDGAMEREKVIVPQFVADWYEDIVDEFYVVLERLVLNYKNNTDMPICKWFFETEDALTILINMHQFGYTVEKEKRYLVEMKGIDTNFSFLNRHRNENYWIFSSKDKNTLYQTHHTRKELEEAGFGWVFDCPGIGIEEVE